MSTSVHHTNMQNHRVVLDTNCLLACIASKSENYRVWKDFQMGLFTLCVSNEILDEYHEIISRKTNPKVADNVVNAIIESEFVEFVDPQFHLGLIVADPDDNKFVDCAFAANAAFIVSDDNHFNVLDNISFPRLLVMRLNEFVSFLQKEEN